MPSDEPVAVRKVAVITGASRGLGAAVAERAARSGHDVVLVARDKDRLEAVAARCRELGARAINVVADVLHPAVPALTRDRAVAEFGRVDGLVNNAGIYRTSRSVEVEQTEWDEVLALNLTIPFRMAVTLAPAMREVGGGSIVNIGSVFSLVGVSGTSAYAASKGGLTALSRALAVEWARFNIRVNVVAAGHMLTDMTSPHLETEAGRKHVQSEIPLRRIASPEEMAPLVCFLLGDDSPAMTGSVVVADGGFTAR